MKGENMKRCGYPHTYITLIIIIMYHVVEFLHHHQEAAEEERDRGDQ